MRGRIVRLGIVLGIVVAIAPAVPAAAGGGGCHEAELSSGRTTRVLLNNACFTPTLARVPVGSTVSWFNKDHFNHTVTGVNLSFGDVAERGVDAVWRVKFDRAGVYPYYCYLHAGMVGSIVVGADSQLIAALRRTTVEFPENVVAVSAKAPVKADASRTKETTSVWPALAAGIGLASVGLGFGFGRRARRHEVPSSPSAS